LIVERGGRLNAIGTREQPIVMTSDQPVGSRGRGDWGGLIINGRAPVNLAGGLGTGEGDTGVYGGTDENDNSGTLRYVRVEFSGIEFSPDNELNGIAFQGVGRGTTVDYAQAHMSRDDAMEWFGGTVDVKHLVLSNAADDGFDWTFGYRGRAQFVVLTQRGDDADNGSKRTAANSTTMRCLGRTHNSTTSPFAAIPTGTRVAKDVRAAIFRRVLRLLLELPHHRIQDKRASDRDDEHRDHSASRQRNVADGRWRDLEYPDAGSFKHRAACH
jgi:hypothetical protein